MFFATTLSIKIYASIIINFNLSHQDTFAFYKLSVTGNCLAFLKHVFI